MSGKSIAIKPGKLKGEIWIQPSKSLSHRGLICAALANGTSILHHLGESQDITATCRGLEALGLAKILGDGPTRAVSGGYHSAQEAVVDCGESGSTLRFLLPLALACQVKTRFIGGGRLFQRPMEPYLAALRQGGAEIETSSEAIQVSGRLWPGTYCLPGNVSSQYISGLLLALPLLHASSAIQIEGPLESAAYIDLTRDVQSLFGVTTLQENSYIEVSASSYQPISYQVEGDWSHAAFYLVANFLGGDIACHGLYGASRQGDRQICDILTAMGGRLWQNSEIIKILPEQGKETVIDASQVPDLVPALAVAACGVIGETQIVNAQRLRLKESDRLAAITAGITGLGGNIQETADGLRIQGTGGLRGGHVSAWGDHRIAMALAIAAAICQEPVVLEGYETVAKSAPHFWEEFQQLGGEIHEYV